MFPVRSKRVNIHRNFGLQLKERSGHHGETSSWATFFGVMVFVVLFVAILLATTYEALPEVFR